MGVCIETVVFQLPPTFLLKLRIGTYTSEIRYFPMYLIQK